MQLPFAVVPYPFTTYSVQNERSNRPASHLSEFKSKGMVWQTNGNTTLLFKGDLGSPKPVNFVALLLTNAQPSTKFQFLMSNDPTFSTVSYNSTSLDVISPSITREDGLYHSHLEIPSVQTYRYFDLTITGHTGDFQAAFLVIGQKLTPANYYSPDFEFGVEDQGNLDWTRYGVAEEESGVIMRKLALTFSWMSQSDMETKFRPFVEKLGKRGMALWCFDPEATAYRQAKTYFGHMKEPAFATGASPKQTNYEMKFEILSLI